ncbi:unnamed protein product [Boreogadus saida]
MAAMRQRGADTAADIAEWADDFTVTLHDALSLLVSSESDDSDRDKEGASPPASPLQTERPGAAALPVSAATSLPVVGALVAEPPGIIARAAANLGLAVPMPQDPQCPDQLRGIWGLEAATRPARLDPIWPMFPAISPYFSGAAAEPGRLGAPVKTFIQVTKTEGLADRGYRAVPPMGPVCHLWWMTCRPLPRRQRNSGDTSPALCLHPGGSIPLQAPVAAIGPRQSLSRRRRQLLLLAPRLTSTARLHRRLRRAASEGPGQRAHGAMSRPTSAGEGNYRAREKRRPSINLVLLIEPALHYLYEGSHTRLNGAARLHRGLRRAASKGLGQRCPAPQALRDEGEACDSEKQLFTKDGCFLPVPQLTPEPAGSAITVSHASSATGGCGRSPCACRGCPEESVGINRGRGQYGEYHRLCQELRLDEDSFKVYFRLNRQQFEGVLTFIGPTIAKMNTNYRESISPPQRLCICLR